jgi:hypothetical protein
MTQLRSIAVIAVCLAVCACGDDDTAGNTDQAGNDGSAGRKDISGGKGGVAAGTGGKGGSTAGKGGSGTEPDAGAENDAGATDLAKMSFFVSSDTSTTGKLGGLDGADARCAKLAKAVGAGDKTWHAYLSTKSVNARDRIGKGPWFNSKGVMLAQDLDALHARKGDAEVFIDEHGGKINGQWMGSPSPVQHDIFTGSKADGTLLENMTCDDWTSDSDAISAQVGHSDGLGPGGSTDGTYTSWNSSHANQNCKDTAPRGGAGRIYCFVP